MSVATPSAPVKPTPPQAPSIGNTDQAAPATDAGAGSNMASPEVVAAVRKLEALGASLQGTTQDGAAASKKPSTGKEAEAAKPTAKAAGSKQGVQAVSEAGEEQPETAAASQTAAAGLPPKAPSTGGMSSNLPLMVLLLVAVVGIAGWYFSRGRKPARQAEKPLPTGVDRLAGQPDGTEKKKRSGRFEVRI